MKKITILVLIFCFLLSPIVSYAQSDTTESQRHILIARIVELQKILAQLLSLQNTTTESEVSKVSIWSPAQRLNSSCVTSDKTGYIICFGGRGDKAVAKNITLFDPDTNRPGYYPETIPFTYASACASDSKDGIIYCFGGYTIDSFGKFVPGNDVWTLNLDTQKIKAGSNNGTELPFRVSGMSCVESEHNRMIYCFGGYISKSDARNIETYENYGGQIFSGGVIAFNPDTLEIDLIKGTEKIAGDDKSCTYHSKTKKIYCFGGDTGGFPGGETDQIFSFDPDTQRLRVLNSTLPQPLSVTSCVSHPNGKIYCLGGAAITEDGKDQNYYNILSFDPTNQKIIVLGDMLQEPLAGHSCALDPENKNDIYCFGGSIETESGVFRYTP